MMELMNKDYNEDGDEDDAKKIHVIEARGASEKVTRVELWM